MWKHGSRKEIIPFFRSYVPRNREIVDVGCGSGYGTYQLYQSGYKVTGIDLSEKMVQLAKKRSENKIPFIQGDVNSLPLEDGSVDGILAINVLEWTKTPSVALVELKRVLATDGYLCIGVLGPTAGPRANSYPRVYGEDIILNTMMPWEFMQLATENGFTLTDHFGVFKKEINQNEIKHLPLKLQQALSFIWVFMMQKQTL